MFAVRRRRTNKDATQGRRRRLAATTLAAAGLTLVAASAPAAAQVTPLPGPACTPVEYGGAGEPDVILATDLPMQGASAGRSEQMVAAVRLALEDASWQAGERRVGLQVCDDSLATTGAWDAATCRANAEAYASRPDVFAVVGTYNSGCAAEMLPILGQAPGGPVAMVSPGNTLVCLTEPGAGCPADEPARFYPTGTRNYVRVVPNDADQAAGLVTFARAKDVRRPFVLFAAGDATSRGQAQAFIRAAKRAGVRPAGLRRWDPEGRGRDFRAVMRKVRRSGADAVVLAGLTEQAGGALIRAKVAVLGPNAGAVKLIAFDGFAQQSTIDSAQRAARGMFVGVPGRAPDALTGRGASIVERLGQAYDPVELYAPYAAQAAAVALDAIARTTGDRAGVAPALLATEVQDGIVGTFSFTESGDTTARTITVFRARQTFQAVREVEPPAALVAAARG